MSGRTGIEWTEATWNPVVGCDRVSPGCAHCYAKTLHDRRHAAVQRGAELAPQYALPFEVVQLMPNRLDVPLHWRTPRRVFVNSVSDLFHDDVPDEFIEQVFTVMAKAERHTFQILTKRPARMLNWFMGRALVGTGEELLRAARGRWPLPNVWLGVSVENQRWANERIPLLLETPAAVRFLSCEPLLGPVELDRWLLVHKHWRSEDSLPHAPWHPPYPRHWYEPQALVAADWSCHIQWVIAGGESGRGARPCELDWLRSLRDQCQAAGVAYFLKQLGGTTNKRGGDKALLDGQRYVEMPAIEAAA